jgi:signal transduction histidine kinase
VGVAGYGLDHLRSARRLEVEKVRTRIATDLHDDIGASLSRMVILTEVLKKKAPDQAEELSGLADLARELVGSMSDIVWATDPRRDDLASVLRRVRSFASDVLESQGIAFEGRVAPECEKLKLSPDPRRQLYLILKEGVLNIARHSNATEARLSLSVDGRMLVAELSDNGRGIEPRNPPGSGFAYRTVHGVPNMKARAEAAGGTFLMDTAPERGTTVWVRVPLTHA